MPLCKEKKAAESEVLATCLQHISAVKTRRCRNRKPRWESEQAEWASSSLCQNNYLSHRRVDFPMKPQHRARVKKHAGADEKKTETSHRCGCISVGSLAALQIWTAASTGRIVHLAANSISSVLHFPSASSSAAQLCTWTEAAAPNGKNSNSLCSRFLVFGF